MDRDPLKLLRDCANTLALTVGELMSISRTAPRRYFVWEIDKRSGTGKRTVCHPARELKSIQYYFLQEVLADLPIHPAATAYVSESSITKNAKKHATSRVIMKLDFADFFNSLKCANWRKFAKNQFSDWSDLEMQFSCNILFWGGGGNSPKCLAIGAPTSPLLSNALMYEVDVKLAEYAEQFGLNYSRYADDITFSSKEWLDYDKVLDVVQGTLASATYTSVRLNERKTILVSNNSARRVTGLMITPDNKISLGRSRKRLISSMVHHASCKTLAVDDWPKLAGLLSFAADAEPDFVERLKVKYTKEVLDSIIRPGKN